MKQSQWLFIVLWLGLIGLVGWWWQQRYASEVDELQNTIRGLESKRKNRAMQIAIDGMGDLLTKIPIDPKGSGLVRSSSSFTLADTPEAKSIDWKRNDSGAHSMSILKPQSANFDAIVINSNEVFKARLELGSTSNQEEPDTMLTFDFNFNQLSKALGNATDFYKPISDSLGIKIKFLGNRLSPIATSDTLGKWYFTASDVQQIEKNSKIDFRLIHEFIVLENYNSYLIRKIWQELLAGITLLLALTGLFFLVRRDTQRQEQQLRQKDRLLANVAHELKTPIATVGVALEALQNFGADADPVRRKEYTRIARSELDRLNLLSERALKTIQLDSGALMLNKRDIMLEPLIEKAWSSIALKHQLSKHQLCYFEVQKTAIQQQQIFGDPELLLHLIYNLLDNACKYGGTPPQITISLHQSDGNVAIDISDNGKGIPDAERQKIFQKFYRIDTNQGHNIKGHGLGLSYAKQIATSHGGRLIYLAQNQLGMSTFRIILPQQS